MTNKEAIEFLKNMIDREAIGFVCPKGEGDVAIWQYHVKALQMAISALHAQEELYVDSKCKTCRYYHDYDDVRCMICDDENDMHEEQEVKNSTESSSTHKALDAISRQAAIDAECEVCQIAPKKERGHNCTYYVHGCKEIECLRALPSAQPEIIRCKDCIKREMCRTSTIWAVAPKDDWYCADAGRRPDA